LSIDNYHINMLREVLKL